MSIKSILNLDFWLKSAFFLALSAFILWVSFDYLDHDFPWHLRIGEQIAREGQAPSIDLYNHSMLGREYIDHEWLFNLLFYKIYSISGFISLNIFFALVLAATFFGLKELSQRFFIAPYETRSDQKRNNLALAGIMTLSAFAAYAMTPFYGVRMQIFGNLLFLVLLIILESAHRRQNWKILFLLPPLFLFWANLHGSFLLGLVIMWAWIAYRLCERLASKIWIRYFDHDPWPWISIGRASFIATFASLLTLLNPYGLKLYSFLSGYKNTYYMSSILEWRPFHHLPISYPQIFLMTIFLAVLIISLMDRQQTDDKTEGIKRYIKKPYLWQWSLALLFLLMAFRSKRHFPLFMIASFPLIIQFYYFGLRKEISFSLNKRAKTIVKLAFLAIFVFSSLYFLSKARITNDPFSPAYSPAMPHRLTAYLESLTDLDQKKILNDYGWGGFFLWKIPEAKLMIDGRMPQAEYEHHSLIEEYSAFFEEGKTEDMIKKHAIDMVILQKEPAIKLSGFEKKFFRLDEKDLEEEPNHLRNYLEKQPSWKKIYEDELGLIYELTD